MLYLAILILSLAGGYFLPWWIVGIIAFFAALLFGKTNKHTFWSAFAAIFTGWPIVALVKSIPNDNMLATRFANMFQLPNRMFILFITALIGGGGVRVVSIIGDFDKKSIFKTAGPLNY